MAYFPPQTPTFEKDRIRALKNERISSQKKTFTKWMNSFLNKSSLHVNNLFEDLADGRILISLLEIISGEKLGVAARGKLRVHKIQNINRALGFLQKSVKLESIGAEDIIDGNEQLILGLVWMIILRFQIADISYEDEMSRERKSAKEALLLWCQRMTRGYPGVDIKNFTTSWRNGLAFNALIHKHRPDLIDYASLRPSQHETNLTNAFNVAEERLGITRLLDVEDVDCPRPDDRSIMTYVSAYYQYFAKMKSEETGGRRVAKIISVLMEIEEMQGAYETMVSDLLSWINNKIQDMAKPFHKSLSAVKKEMISFKHFRTIEKPPKYAERVNIEAHLFSLQTKRTANNQKPYIPPEGSYVKDVNRAWQVMESAEHDRALALRNELIRQEMLEKMADKFERKAALRESWLDDMMHVLEEEQLAQDAATVESALKRHEAISTDVKAREERFQMVFDLAQELIDEDYHKADAVRQREDVIMTKWDKLVSKLHARRTTLMGLRDLVGVFRDMDSAHSDMMDIETGLRSEDYGRHLLDVENLLQKHSLFESQIQAQGERIQRIDAQAVKFIKADHPETKMIKERQKLVTQAFQALLQLGKERRARLEDSLKLYKFFGDLEEEEIFIKESEQLASSKEVGKDLASLTRLQQRHEALEAEISGRFAHCEMVCARGQSLVDRGHFASKEIKAKIKQGQANWIRVKELAQNRKERLKDAAQSLQYYSDANDAESWMKEKLSVVQSDDYGRDEQSATSLLQRHRQVQEEISSFSDDISKLKEQSKLMGETSRGGPAESEPTYESYTEEMEVEMDEEVEETIEKEVIKDVIREVKVPQVVALYPYSGQGLAVEKGETLYLINKTNNDWWSVRRTKSKDAGYVPAKYVKEIEPRVVQKNTKQKVMVPQIVKVKKKVKTIVAVERQRPVPASTSSLPKSPRRGKLKRGVKRHFTAHFDRDNVAVRQITLTNTYNRLLEASQFRQQNLENAIKYYHFSRECDDMDMWMTNKEKQLNSKDTLHASVVIQAIRKKLERFETELSAKNSSMAEINLLADELITNEHSDSLTVKKRRKELNERWGKLQKLKKFKEEELEEKHGVELFFNSCEEMRSWITEKDGMLYTEDVGRDIETVRALQRRHQGVERDLAAVEDKVSKLKDQARTLVSQHPRQARQIKTKEEDIIGLWNGLKKKACERKAVLDNAYGQQGFLADTRDLLSWANNATQSLKSAEDPHDISSAETMIQKHNEMLEDIQTHYDRFDQLQDYAQKLLSANPRAVKVKQNVSLLKQAKAELNECWSERNDHLQQAQDLQIFIRDAEHLDAGTASHEAYLSNEDLGASIDDVERLLKKHEDMEKTLVAQDERVHDLSDLANSLVRADHFEKKWISKRKDEVVKRRQNIKHRAKQRRDILMQSQLLQNFLRDADEFGAWILEKSQIATDESYRDPKNLQGKLQRHEAFEAEITANKDGIDRINTVGKNLIRKKHFGSQDIQNRIKQLNEDWQKLLANSTDKGCKLQQARQQQQFNRSLDDFREWMHDVEAVLGSEELGRDLSGVKFLLKKHQLVEADIEVHVTEARALSKQAQELIDDNHFNSQDIQQRTRESLKRFKELKSLSSNRRAHLEDSFGLNQLFYDIEMEMFWVREHEQLASSGDLGSNLLSVQRLQKRHLAFENELTNHEPKIESVLSCGQDLIDSGHYASDRVEDRIDELSTTWKQLSEATCNRKLKLDESHDSQKFFAEANEADSWMNDKAGLAASQDYGKDESATDKLLTKHTALETDVESFSKIIADLAKDAKRLVHSRHFDSEKIKSMQRDLEEQLSGLRTLVSSRRLRLDESKKLHQYMREVDETAEWINDQLHIAGSEDYGKDFEHLEIIQNKFDDFQRSVAANTDTYRAVDNLAKKLVAEGHTDTVTIKEQQDILRSMWAQLEDQITLRMKRLKSAAEIHRFNRDMNELISRIQEKDAGLTLDDLGRDLATAQALQRKHDVFERELVAVEQQVNNLVTESNRLQTIYQGQTAQTIRKHEQSVLGLWEELKRKSSRKKHKLRDNTALHKINNSIRDQITWCIDVERIISSDEPIHNVSDAEAMLRQLEEHHVVMESREETFTRLLETGEKMIENDHFATEELTEKLELLLTERESLYATWDDRKVEVDQACDLHVFLRDARQVDSLYSSQEAVLAKAEPGDSVDEVDFLLKKHENVEKLVLAQDDKVNAVFTFGNQLIDSNHKDSGMINQRLSVINERRSKIKKDLKDRRKRLEESRKISQFYQDVVEAESWIVEKLQTALDESYKDPSNLESKLQKHQVFEAELTAHRGVIDAVQKNSEELISSGHFAASEVESRIESLYVEWEELLEASETKAKKLEEARDHKKFNQEVDIADSCISDKEAIVSSEDNGRDYDHCVRLQKKMKEFDQDLAVEEDRVFTINHLADKLIKKGHAGAALIYQRQQALNERWNSLQDKASERRQRLAEACEIHAFDRSCVDVANMIKEKVAILSTEDLGRDLPGVEALIRKHDDVERALTVIESKMEMLENEAHRLVRSQPHMARIVQTKQTEIIESWEQLNDKFDERKSLLEANRLRQIFLVDYRDLMSWMNDLALKISSGELAKSVQDAQALLDLHKERKSEMEAREETTRTTHAFGLSLVAQNNFAEEIQKEIKSLQEMRSRLQELWKDRQQMLQQSYELEVFLASAEQNDNWITNKQKVATDKESKDSLDTVESLLKSQVNFEKSIAAYEDNVKSLENSAELLIKKKHYDFDIIKSRRDEVLGKWYKLKRLAAAKSEQLGESKLLFQFLRDAKELESWINEKLQTAAEASYREAKNLNLKLQKHQTFEAEVTANRGQLESVIKDGQCLANTSPSHRDTIDKRLKDLRDLWTLLEDLSHNKAQRLKEAIQKQTFERNVTELETWMDEMECALSLKEYGRDLRSVKSLIKKHDLMEEAILNHEDRVREMLRQAEEFEEAGHFQKEEIGERAADVAERFEQLTKPAAERKHKLQDSLVLHQFLSDAQAEIDWTREKESLVSSKDYGYSLNGVQNLLKKHEAFEAELTTHEELVKAAVERANEAITRGHYASGVMMENSSNLEKTWNEFQRLAQIRKTKLKESLATQQYYTQVSEVEAWVQDKLPFVSNEDYGRDETSAQALLRKHETLELEFERFGKKIDELENLCKTLAEAGNFDAENVKQRQRELQDRYSELSDISSYRHRRLLESCRLFIFLREVDEVDAWIEEKETIVTSDDCGRDLEHVDMLMEKFEAFTRDLVMSGERIAKLTAHAQELLDDEHSDSETIEQRAEQICTRWEVLKERTNERLDALDQARDLHTFNRNVDETNAWIQEKESALMFSDDGARDLSSVQALQRKHEGFQRDLKALGKKVTNLSQEAETLIEKFPQNQRHFHEQKHSILEAWESLQQRASSKKSVLSQSEGLQTFLNDYRDLMTWIDTMVSSIATEEVASDFTAAEKLIAQHQEYQTEVAAHDKSVQEFQEVAKKLIKSGHPNVADIREKKNSLQDAWCRLLENVSKKQEHLEQVKEIQRFKREADQLEGWLYARDSDILSEDVGDSLEAVEELLKKQDEFEKILLAKGEHFEDLTRLTNQEMENEKKEKEREIEIQKEIEKQMIKKQKQEKKRLENERRKAKMEEEERRKKAILIEQKQEKERLEKERRKAKMEEEERRQKAILIEQRKQEEKRLKEERKRNKEMKQKQDLEIQQQEIKRKQQEKNRIDRENKKTLDEKGKEVEKNKMILERKRIDDAKIRKEQLSRQVSSPPQESFRKDISSKVSHDICEGLLQRKQELDIGGQRATIQTWKTFYTILSGGKLLFYKEKNAAVIQGAHASPSIDLKGATCTLLGEATHARKTFRLQLEYKSQFLFNTQSEIELHLWVSEINKCIKEHSSSSSEPIKEPQRSSKLLAATNNLPSTNDKMVRPHTPVIKVTSFDSEEENEIVDDDDDNTEEIDDDYIDSFIDSPPNVPPPVVPDVDSEPDIPQSADESYDKYDRHENNKYSQDNNKENMDILSECDIHPEFYPDTPTDKGYDKYDRHDYDNPPKKKENMDILSEEDIHPEFYPDAPTDFNDNSIPEIPCIPPPDFPTVDLGDLEEGIVDEEDLMVYPKAPPPPVRTDAEVSASLGNYEAGNVSSGSEGIPSPPPPLIPSKSDFSNQPSRPHRKKRAPPPPKEARYRSDSRDSDDFPPNVPPPKPPLKPKPKSVDSRDEKKHEKKKGMFGFLKKKK